MAADVVIAPEPLTPAAYARFGDVLTADRDDVAVRPANLGTAERRNHLLALVNDRPGSTANFASFRCSPRVHWPMRLTMLEKHPHSTQVFIPMNAARYLVVVAEGVEQPELTKLRAFLANGRQAISYRPGVWHHPMIALDAVTDFACLVWEDESAGDCVEHSLARENVLISAPA